LTEEYFPEERRDQFIYRGKKVSTCAQRRVLLSHGTQVIIECQKHSDYQESLDWLLSFIEEYARHGKAIADKGKEHATDAAEVRVNSRFSTCTPS
jgi:hypothetical protein